MRSVEISVQMIVFSLVLGFMYSPAFASECFPKDKIIALSRSDTEKRQKRLDEHLKEIYSMKLSHVVCLFGRPHEVEPSARSRNFYLLRYGNPLTEPATDDKAYEFEIDKDEFVVGFYRMYPKLKKGFWIRYDRDKGVAKVFNGTYSKVRSQSKTSH